VSFFLFLKQIYFRGKHLWLQFVWNIGSDAVGSILETERMEGVGWGKGPIRTFVSARSSPRVVKKHPLECVWNKPLLIYPSVRSEPRPINNNNFVAGYWNERRYALFEMSLRLHYHYILTPIFTSSLESSACYLLHAGFLLGILLRPWRWRRHIPPKHPFVFSRLHGVISQKLELFRKLLDFHGFQVLNAVAMKNTISSEVTPCSGIEVH
jgi:hypothetical protein